jgi:putative membrane protein
MTFSDQDHERIHQAVTDAEHHTRGEIVPIVIDRSALYRETRYRTGIGFAFFILVLLLTMELEWMPWGWHPLNAGWMLLAVVAAYGLGYWFGTSRAVIRLLTSQERMDHKVKLRAHQVFWEHGLHRTQLGTGVLILISLLEHRIEILTDRPILDRVPGETWNHMVSLIQKGFQKGNPVESLCQAIALCGDVLRDYFPASPAEPNPNELPNTLISD